MYAADTDPASAYDPVAAGHQQHDPEADHGDRQPRDESARAEQESAGDAQDPAVRRQHRRPRRMDREATVNQSLSLHTMSPWSPTSPRTTHCCSCRSEGRRRRRTSCRSWRTSTRGRGIPRERLEEVGEHYHLFGGRSPINDQNRELPGGAARGPGRRRDRAPGLLGQPQLGPVPHRHDPPDGEGRRDPGRLLPHQRLLVVLRLPAVPREPRRRRGRGGGRAAAGPAAPVLQPPRLHRAGRRRDARRAGRPARPGPRGRPPGVRRPTPSRRR